MLQYTLQAVRLAPLQAIAADAVCELIKATADREQYRLFQNYIVPQLLSFRPLLDQPDVCFTNVSQIFIEAGENYTQFILEYAIPNNRQATPNTPNPDDCHSQSTQLIHCLLDLTRLCTRKSVMQVLHVWFIVQEEIAHCNRAVELKAYYSPVYLQLLSLLLPHLRFPSTFHSLNSEEQDEIKAQRYSVAEALLDAAAIVGPQRALQTLFNMLGNEYESYQRSLSSQSTASPLPVYEWQNLEAVLYAIRSIARKITPEEQEYLPKIMEIIMQAPIIQQHFYLRYTSTLIIGRYADWIQAHHTVYLQPALQFVISGLNDVALQSSCALSLRHLCESSALLISSTPSLFTELLGVYTHAMVAVKETNDQKEIIGGMAAIVSRFPAATIQDAMHKLINPIAMQIDTILNQQTSNPAHAHGNIQYREKRKR